MENQSAGEQEEAPPVMEAGPNVPIDEGDVGERAGEVMVHVPDEDQRSASRQESGVAAAV